MHPHWYPGHMHKARKEIKETLKKVDVIIEVVDARLPFSSANPVVADIRKQKPFIVLMNKSDLADERTTSLWQQQFESEGLSTHAISNTQTYKHIVIDLCEKAAPARKGSFKRVNAMIMGIPNVGKSTIINHLADRTIAKVGNEPAVTKRQQRIQINEDLVLHDTPGILWPKFYNPHSGYRLAVAGSIKDTAIDYEDVGFYAIDYLAANYPEALKKRYGIKELPKETLHVIELIGKSRGAKSRGGRVDLHKTCEIIIHEFRAHTLGNITLETPEMVNAELEKIAVEMALKEEKLADKK